MLTAEERAALERGKLKAAEDDYYEAIRDLIFELEAHEQAGFLGKWLHVGSPHLPDPNNRPNQDPQLSIALAANGGGYRASNFTYGVMKALEALRVGPVAGGSNPVDRSLLSEVDVLSTVSGGGFPAARHAWYARHPELPQPMAEDLLALRHDLTLQTLLFDDEKRAKRYSKSILVPGFEDLSLGDLQDAKGPLWVPNGSVVPTGARIPLSRATLREIDVKRGEADISAGLGLCISSSVPGAARSIRLESKVKEKPAPTEQRLFDGAWGERWGLLTAIDTLLQMQGPPATEWRKVAIAVDSRPQFQLNTVAGMGIPELDSGIDQRAAAIGTGFEILRYRADEWFLEHAFARRVRYPHPRDLGADMRDTLEHEAFAVDTLHPMVAPLYAKRRVVRDIRDADQEVHLVRLGVDRLLDPTGWDNADRTPECKRTAARLFTVVAMQPTDLALKGPAADPKGLGNRPFVYPYGRQKEAVLERQSLIVAAGVLTTLLHEEVLEQALGRTLRDDHAAVLERLFTEAAPLPWRSQAEAEDWKACTGLGHGNVGLEVRDL